MKVEEALGKDGDRNDAAGQNWPHQQPTFLNVLNHAGFVALFGTCGKPATKGDLGEARPYRELLSRDFGEDDGPVIRGVTRPSNLPDASKME
jgi:hypothetical protein